MYIDEQRQQLSDMEQLIIFPMVMFSAGTIQGWSPINVEWYD